MQFQRPGPVTASAFAYEMIVTRPRFLLLNKEKHVSTPRRACPP